MSSMHARAGQRGRGPKERIPLPGGDAFACAAHGHGRTTQQPALTAPYLRGTPMASRGCCSALPIIGCDGAAAQLAAWDGRCTSSSTHARRCVSVRGFSPRSCPQHMRFDWMGFGAGAGGSHGLWRAARLARGARSGRTARVGAGQLTGAAHALHATAVPSPRGCLVDHHTRPGHQPHRPPRAAATEPCSTCSHTAALCQVSALSVANPNPRLRCGSGAPSHHL